ncbi:MAG: hypothetical protein ACFE7R_01400 [Candidatus Hodarchaeota archaeon]
MLQAVTPLDRILWGVPGILIGLGIGYFIGGFRSLNMLERFFLGLAAGVFGGAILAFALAAYIEVTAIQILLSVVSMLGGVGLGMVIHWAPSRSAPPKHHIIFELDDDEDFDREIDEVMTGKYSESDT